MYVSQVTCNFKIWMVSQKKYFMKKVLRGDERKYSNRELEIL